MVPPVGLQKKSYREWNELVRGLVTVWEAARALGLEKNLEIQLEQDKEATLAELLGRLGNESAIRMQEVFALAIPENTGEY